MKFRLGDHVRVTNHTSTFFDEVGRITTTDKKRKQFNVAGLWDTELWFRQNELTLADHHAHTDHKDAA